MILLIIDIIILSYLLLGFGFWIVPIDSGVGYVICGFEDWNFLFIFLWLPMLFTDKLDRIVSK